MCEYVVLLKYVYLNYIATSDLNYDVVYRLMLW